MYESFWDYRTRVLIDEYIYLKIVFVLSAGPDQFWDLVQSTIILSIGMESPSLVPIQKFVHISGISFSSWEDWVTFYLYLFLLRTGFPFLRFFFGGFPTGLFYIHLVASARFTEISLALNASSSLFMLVFNSIYVSFFLRTPYFSLTLVCTRVLGRFCPYESDLEYCGLNGWDWEMESIEWKNNITLHFWL